MPVVIPQDVKYEERFIGPLTVKQSIYAGIAAMIIIYIWMFTEIFTAVKIILSLIVGGLAAGFVMLNLDIMLLNLFAFVRVKKKASWLSPDAQGLLDIRDIRADTVFLKKGGAIGLIKVTPINFGMLSKEDQDSVIYGFLEFLNTINFPIQIVMKSINLDINDYLSALKHRIEERDDKISLAYYEHFASYMRDYIESTRINDRLFYIVVPAKKHWDEREVIRSLDTRCKNIMDALAFSGINSERLNKQQLLNLYASYFTETLWLDEDFVTAVTMYRKMWKRAPRAAVYGEV
ncbi:MAG: hypothetical protein DRO62_02705 [Candidatus Altiarchaeales archaeon]|nr:MAG: hypothetical protein DRO62_02705 [Candidatus Altiarchaeales archaeon]